MPSSSDDTQSRTTITEIERMTLVGILTLAAEYRAHLDNLLLAACRITGEQPDGMGYAGHTSDALWSNGATADELLRKVGKRVERQERADG